MEETLLVLDINHTLRVSVSKVALVGRSAVDFVLVQGVFDFIREDTSGKAGDEFLGLVGIRVV